MVVVEGLVHDNNNQHMNNNLPAIGSSNQLNEVTSSSSSSTNTGVGNNSSSTDEECRNSNSNNNNNNETASDHQQQHVHQPNKDTSNTTPTGIAQLSLETLSQLILHHHQQGVLDQAGALAALSTLQQQQQQLQQLQQQQTASSSSNHQDPATILASITAQQQQLAAILAGMSHQQQQHQQLQQHQHQQHHQHLANNQQQQPLPPAALVEAVHNLIPQHLQSTALAGASSSLHGTPGHPSALIPPPSSGIRILPPPLPNPPALTVQDRPMCHPVFNGVNPNYPGLRVLNTSPPVFAVDNFLTKEECDFLILNASDAFAPAPVVGKGAGEISPSRTSSTCYLAREDLPNMMNKISILTGKPIDHCELPQVGRYLPTQQYLQHYDAFDLSTEDGRRFAMNGGQRTITCLIYLNDVAHGGHTQFPALNLSVQPRRGMCLVFFPATVDGALDQLALHAAMPAVDTKFVSQVWIRQSTYNGAPSKRLPVPMGSNINFLLQGQNQTAAQRQEFQAAAVAELLHLQQIQQQQHQPQQPQQQQQQQQLSSVGVNGIHSNGTNHYSF